jgi:hypothetical protein
MTRAYEFAVEVLKRTSAGELFAWTAGFALLLGILLLVVSILGDIYRQRRAEREAGMRQLMEGLSADSALTICRHGVAGHRPCPECWEYLSQLHRNDRRG